MTTPGNTGASAFDPGNGVTHGYGEDHRTGFDGSAPAAEEQRSLGDIVGDIARDLTTLFRQEVDLAKTEAKAEVVKAGKGAGLLGAAGVAGHLTLLLASLALTFLLDEWMPLALAALIVTVLWAVVAAVLGLRGRKELRSVNPKLADDAENFEGGRPMGARTEEQLTSDIEATRQDLSAIWTH